MTRAELREAAFVANRALAGTGLVLGTFGNVSAADRGLGELAIKPSGVRYEELRPEQMAVVSLETGEVVDGTLRPSSDTPTHRELYRAFPAIGGVVHTHSEYATAFAQGRQPIRCMGTTHADYFCVDVPVTRALTREEVESDYERNTGLVIVETVRGSGAEADAIGAILVANHGPFAWGPDALAAVERAEVLEYLARLEWRVRTLAPDAPRPDAFLVDKHYRRKHGPSAYYGQPGPRGQTRV
jgi:L-ribulose-5-phosphate 4-epimerase